MRYSFFSHVFAIALMQILTTVLCTTPQPSGIKDVSHEDIRDAILTLVHMFRDSTDKLERHEYRERQLGDQLKKILSSVEKKQKPEEIAQVAETLSAINRRLESIENTISKEKSSPVSDNASASFQASVLAKLNEIEESIRRNELLIESIRSNSIQKLETIFSSVQQSQSTIDAFVQKFLQSITDGNAELANKFETKFVHLESLRGASEKILTLQQSAVDQIGGIRQSINELAGKEAGNYQNSDDALNQKLDEIRYTIRQISENGTARWQEQAVETNRLLSQNHLEIISTLTNTTDDASKNANTKHDELLQEIKDLSKIEQVLIQTADNVLDTKRRIEYGTHQILMEVGELIKTSSRETNETVHRRFDTISTEILNSTNGALQNLSSKLETEISQVWRQIGIMYQTLTNSADALDKLQIQTEIYVNGSLSTMDNMQGKVGQITGRMSEVDENLNYLLGRLSLVTQEFNQIKTGLGQALDNIRKSFHTVQDKVKDVGPGPNPIEEEDSASTETPLQKTKYDTVN